MNEVRKCVNEEINIAIEYQIILNSLKRELPEEAIYDIYRTLKNSPNSINTNLLNYLKKNNVKGVSKQFVRKNYFLKLDYFESKISPDSIISAKEFDAYLMPCNISKSVQIDKSFLNTRDPYKELFLEIMQVEVELFNKLENQRSIIDLRLKAIRGDSVDNISKIFEEISSGNSNQDQRFVNLDTLNLNLRQPEKYSILDPEDFFLLNLAVNNTYDSDSEISKEEFISFCLPHRKKNQQLFRSVAKKLISLDPNEDRKDLEELMKDCQFEDHRSFSNFLDGGVIGDKGYQVLGEDKEWKEKKLTQIIRRGEVKDQTLNFDRYTSSNPSENNISKFMILLTIFLQVKILR